MLLDFNLRASICAASLIGFGRCARILWPASHPAALAVCAAGLLALVLLLWLVDDDALAVAVLALCAAVGVTVLWPLLWSAADPLRQGWTDAAILLTPMVALSAWAGLRAR